MFACSRVNACTTRMPAMSSASVAVTSPRRSRTARYARVECVAEERGRDAHQRDHGEGGEREPPVEDEEQDRRADEGERVLDEAGDAVRDELVERLDVVRQPADDHARAVPLEEAEREPLEVAEEPERRSASIRSPTQPVRYVCAYVMPQFAEPGGEEDPDDR